jgi:hypothetical protein
VILKLIYTVLASIFCLYTGFIVVYSVKKAMDEGLWIPPGLKQVAQIWLVLGYPADVIYNLVFGSHKFETFSAHLQRETDKGNPKVSKWVTFVNFIAKGHIKK